MDFGELIREGGGKVKDYYKVLGVRPGAPAEVIKAAYRALMKIHHPDVGGSKERAQEIEEAYRQLAAALEPARSQALAWKRPSPPAPTGSVVPQTAVMARGRHLELSLVKFQANEVYPCPRECSFSRRRCRYKQQFSLDGTTEALRASTLLIRVRNFADYSQQVDCLNGHAVLVDQKGDFYACKNVCTWQHPPKYKEANIEMFPGTQATLMLWFPQLEAGRYSQRFIYKHKVVVRDERGDWLDEDLMELVLA